MLLSMEKALTLIKKDVLKGSKKKKITQIMMLKLIEIAQKEGGPELEKSY